MLGLQYSNDLFSTVILFMQTSHFYQRCKKVERGNLSLPHFFRANDFKRGSIDGLGDEWPISYDDVKPYYDKVDKLIGVTGTKENIYNEYILQHTLDISYHDKIFDVHSKLAHSFLD